ncbi:hypothetical protein DEU34_1780 [Microbacterium sp. AG1240]|uniref:hypothetical protein n=1 Tax=Microbacterium sp. AG1240 TaxID=2183992 RepID=UPI000F21EFD6|nr:hypothetical protein [Microbacterium sp. AG1240]RKT33190.1 hypothetical protein DEU34_1780 [Microbacterium sp. AG1240]
MTPSTQERYRRLLRWYPKAWRTENEDVVLGTLLDVADGRGGIGPSVRERWSVIVHGLGTRMDVRAALGASLVGLLLAAVAGGLAVWGTEPVAKSGLSWLPPLLTVCAIPVLAAFGLIAIARQRGIVSPPRAIVAVVLSFAALSLAFVASQAWGLAFDLADEGEAPTGLAAAFAAIFIAAWLTGAAAIAAFLGAVLARSGVPVGFALVVAAVCGAIAAPVVGVSLLSPTVSTIAVAGVAVLSLALLRPRRDAAPVSSATAPVPVRTLRLARGLAIIGLAGGLLGIAYAVTGASWSPGATDGTEAMAHGITVSVLAGIPLLGAFVVVGSARRGTSAVIWGPPALLAASLCAIAAAYVHAPSWSAMAPALAVSAALGGAALAWWLAARLRGPAVARIVTAALLGLGYASFLGTMLAPMVAFFVPIAAFFCAIWGARAAAPRLSARGAGEGPIEA